MIKLEKGMTILFQGDSITDAGRMEDPRGIGCGFVAFLWAYVNAFYPELELNFINKGIGGELSEDMLRRWDADVIEPKPDVLVFMAGVNDMWRRYDGANKITTAETFEANMRACLEKTKAAGIDKIVLLEPYLTINTPEVKVWLEEDLCYKQEVVKKLAKEFDAEFVPLQELIDEACKLREPAIWTVEGVHPIWPGCGLIGKNVLKVFGVI